MRSFCPACLAERDIDYITKRETYVVRDEPINIEAKVAVCGSCGNEIFDAATDETNVKKAYNLYREKHGFLWPDEVRSIREAYGLSQRALARALGWGLVTVQRYENGALQDSSHDAILRKVDDDPGFLYDQFEKNLARFSEAEAIRIRTRLSKQIIEYQVDFAVNAYEKTEHIAYVRDKISRGSRPFEYDRFAQAVAYFAGSVPSLFKMKLAKLLWLSDFYHHALYRVSITGLTYSRLPYGPAPDQFQLMLGFLDSNKVITLTPHEFRTYEGETVVLRDDPGLSKLNDEEINCLDRVISVYGGMSSKKLSELSHRELIWKSRSDGDTLPYSEAQSVEMVRTLMKCESS